MNRPRAAIRTKAVKRPSHLPLAALLVTLVTALGLASLARAEGEIVESHGYSFYGDLKYGPDFKHYDFGRIRVHKVIMLKIRVHKVIMLEIRPGF